MHEYWQAASVKPEHELLAESTSPYGEITATLDWCEENLFSPVWFVAEFFNSISNFGMFALGLYGAYRSYMQSMPMRFIAVYVGLATVGLGSFLFHATLLFESQLADELPMMWAMGTYLYCMAPREWRQTDQNRYLLLGVISSYVLGVTVLYTWTRNAVFFETAHGLGAAILLYRCVHWTRNQGRGEKFAVQRRWIATSAISIVGAFVLWNVDNVFCDWLRATRTWLNSPVLAPMLQFHAWWHLGAGYATYLLGLFMSFREVEEEDIEGKLPRRDNKLVPGNNWFGLPILVEKKHNK